MSTCHSRTQAATGCMHLQTTDLLYFHVTSSCFHVLINVKTQSVII